MRMTPRSSTACSPSSRRRRRWSRRRKRAREEGYRELDAFTPFPVDELFPVLRLRDHRVPLARAVRRPLRRALALAHAALHQFRLSDQRRRPAALRAVRPSPWSPSS